MLPLGLIAGGVLGAGEIGYGLYEQNKARKAAAANVMPQYQIPGEEFQNLSQAESQAGQGMSAASRQQLYQNTANTQGQSIDAILRGGGGGDANSISNLASNTQNQLNNTAIYDDKARLANLQNLQSARARVSASRDKAYQVNQYQPWANRAQAISQQLQGSQNMINSGINTFSQGLTAGIAGQQGNSGFKFRDMSGDQFASQMTPNQGQGFQTPSDPAAGWNPQQVNIPSFLNQ